MVGDREGAGEVVFEACELHQWVSPFLGGGPVAVPGMMSGGAAFQAHSVGAWSVRGAVAPGVGGWPQAGWRDGLLHVRQTSTGSIGLGGSKE